MNNRINVAKALKVKNRLVGELTKLQEIARRENSRRDDNPSKVDVGEVFAQIAEARSKLVALKAAIVQASAPAAEELARLAEVKAFLNWLPALPVREGEEKESIGYSKEVITRNWTALYNRGAVDKWVAELQEEANALQDKIDDFNAQTQVAWGG